ncbi:hypothetical protein ACIQBJ_16300 [Kitasatospora sp. NPDC088391]|uniref:hypothetical protein n=1 Tax=Kitasatospora sp. NPDC088391 TaxID=3364074 RepID=UPI00380E5C1D
MITVVRVYDYHPSKLGLLSGTVLPLLGEVGAAHALPVAFCTRGWDGGSHLALHLAGPGLDRGVVDGLSRRLAAAVAARPAPTWSGAEYAAAAERNRALEGGAGFRPRPEPHGTVEVEQVPDDGPLAAPRRTYRTELAGVLRAALSPAPGADTDAASGAVPGGVDGLVTGLLAATAAVYPGGLRLGSLSLRSHAEAFLAGRPDGEQVREHFDRAYRQHRAGLLRLVATGLESPAALPGHGPAARTYAALRTAGHAADVRLLTAPRQRDLPRPQHGAGPEPDAASEFHLTLRRAGFWDAPPEGFREYRVLVNWLYESLPLLDVRPTTRYLCCHLLACAVDEFLGESWQQRLVRRTV